MYLHILVQDLTHVYQYVLHLDLAQVFPMPERNFYTRPLSAEEEQDLQIWKEARLPASISYGCWVDFVSSTNEPIALRACVNPDLMKVGSGDIRIYYQFISDTTREEMAQYNRNVIDGIPAMVRLSSVNELENSISVSLPSTPYTRWLSVKRTIRTAGFVTAVNTAFQRHPSGLVVTPMALSEIEELYR